MALFINEAIINKLLRNAVYHMAVRYQALLLAIIFADPKIQSFDMDIPKFIKDFNIKDEKEDLDLKPVEVLQTLKD